MTPDWLDAPLEPALPPADPPRATRTCSNCFYTVSLFVQHEGFILCLLCEKDRVNDQRRRHGFTEATMQARRR